MINKSFVWKGLKKAELVSKKIQKIDEDSMLVKVESCAVCGSDLRIFNHGNARVKSGRTVGHEISGIVVNVGNNVSKFKIVSACELADSLSSPRNWSILEICALYCSLISIDFESLFK